MGFISEFKTFSMKGNVIDLAIGVVIGAAFSKIVNSFIEDVITPMVLQPALKAAHLTNLHDLTMFGTVKYGMFLSAVINFLIVAFVLFLLIKGINVSKKKEEEKEKKAAEAAAVAAAAAAEALPVVPTQEELLTEIRDLLKNNAKK